MNIVPKDTFREYDTESKMNTVYDVLFETHGEAMEIKRTLNGDPNNAKDTGLCGTVIGLAEKVDGHTRIFQILAGGVITIATGLIVWFVRGA